MILKARSASLTRPINQSSTVVGSENSCTACLYGQTVLLATLDILLYLPPALSHIQIGCIDRHVRLGDMQTRLGPFRLSQLSLPNLRGTSKDA